MRRVSRWPVTIIFMTTSTTADIEPPQKKQKTMSPAMTEGTAESKIPPQAFEQTSLLIQKLSDKARAPTRGSPLSAGYDLYS